MEGQIGSEGKYELNFEGGKAVVGLDYGGADAEAEFKIKLNAIPVVCKALEQAKSLIPGHFDDMAIDAAIELLKKL